MSKIVTILIFGLISISTPLRGGSPWENGQSFRRQLLEPAGEGRPGFTAMDAASLGIPWTNSLPSEKYIQRENLSNGSGLALGDFDNDGLCDIFLCNKFGPSALYKNLGHWRFENVTARAGVACTNQISNGAVFADVNGDGLLDLLVSSFTGPNAFFLNLGGGHFTNITQKAGLISKGGSTSQGLGDLDGDGYLDLIVQYYGVEAILREGGGISTRMVNGKPVVAGRFAKRVKIINNRMVEFGEPAIHYKNLHGESFKEMPWEEMFHDEEGKPVPPQYDFGLAIQIRDINGDGYPDIYTCNDFQTPDRLWLNDGHGKFHPIPQLALRNMSHASMGVDFGDLDRDGNLDFITAEMLSPDHITHMGHNLLSRLNRNPDWQSREEVGRNVFAWNRGDGTYADIAWYAGVAASGWSWTPIFIDVDLDGYEDILISNGHLHDVNFRDNKMETADLEKLPAAEQRKRLLTYPPLNSPKVAFRNRGNLTFENVSDAWNFNSRAIAHGMATADLDNDGDLDIVANCVNGSPLIYRNNASAPRVAVRLKGKTPNTFGIGAKITLSGGPFPQSQEMICGGRYLSSDDTMRVFAVPPGSAALKLEVIWRNGTRTEIANVEPNFLYEISEEGAQPVPPQATPAPRTALFEDVSNRLNHHHKDDPYDDFARQPLLPKMLSRFGPGISWFDLDGDGIDDLMIGSGKGGKPALFKADGTGGFAPMNIPVLNPLPDDSTTLLGFVAGGQRSLLMGTALYEGPATNLPIVSQLLIGSTESPSTFAPSTSSGGPMVLADIDGDGDLDLFVGGRFIPGQYPRPAASRLYLNVNSKFIPAEKANQKLESIGLVSGAVFSDLDNDGLPELILACEWGPVRVFKFHDGDLTEITSKIGLAGFEGLWNSVTTGDFDGDGRMDIIAGNWGLNSFYNRSEGGPCFLYYGDFNNDGRVEMIEAYSNRVMQAIVPFRAMPDVSGELPWIKQRFLSNSLYARASVSQILGDRFGKATELRASNLATTIFWNRGDHFEAEPLPPQAQFAPAFGLTVADFDGDGREDLFVAQNFFAVRTEDDRLDAGRGLLLRGGEKGLTAVPGQESGLKIYGEQRGSAACDFDGDGRVDLCVSQNGSETRLYRNVTAKPGLRIRLKGPSGNPSGYGAAVRIRSNGTLGPSREFHCGSGYWSQESAVQVFAVNAQHAEIVVRWPGGKETSSLVPANAAEVAVDTEGRVEVKKSK